MPGQQSNSYDGVSSIDDYKGFRLFKGRFRRNPTKGCTYLVLLKFALAKVILTHNSKPFVFPKLLQNEVDILSLMDILVRICNTCLDSDQILMMVFHLLMITKVSGLSKEGLAETQQKDAGIWLLKFEIAKVVLTHNSKLFVFPKLLQTEVDILSLVDINQCLLLSC
jgi:hypothetical protein